MLWCISGILVLFTISGCIIAYELRVQDELRKYKERDMRYDG